MSVSSFCDSVEMKIDLFDYTRSKATYQLKVIRENPYKIIKIFLQTLDMNQ